MKPKNIYTTLLNRDALLSTIWSVLQQMVVAASTYFIIKAIQNITNGDIKLGLYLTVAFVASLLLVYLPTTLSMAYLQKWRISSIHSFVSLFIEYNKGKTTLGHTRNKVKLEPWLTNECFNVYDTTTNLIYQMISTAMNSMFSVIVIALTLDSRILSWYVLAGIVLVISNRLFRKKIAIASIALQNTRNQLSQTMLSSWQNIFTGNKYNFENWFENFDSSISESRKKATEYDITRSLISSFTVATALITVAIGNGIYLAENITSMSAIAALMITLPRQLQIIQSIFAFFNLTLSWTGVNEQLKALNSIVQPADSGESSQRYIQFDRIALHNAEKSLMAVDINGVNEIIRKDEIGRWTLRGQNGAGKSTLLAMLKELNGEEAFLLPTHYEDLSFKKDFVGHSDGNRLLSVFNQLSELKELKYVLLDEWDANLDSANLEFVNNAITELAKSKIVLESRHRN